MESQYYKADRIKSTITLHIAFKIIPERCIRGCIPLIMAIGLILACSSNLKAVRDSIAVKNTRDADSVRIADEIAGIDTSRIVFDTADVMIFFEVMDTALAEGIDSLPVAEICIWAGVYFGGKQYLCNTVAPNVERKIVVNLRGFDCVTLVESMVALAHTLKSKDRSFVNYCRKLENNRYRNGKLGDYPERLHYFTEWISDNEKRGTVTDITSALDSIHYKKTINFMTKNRSKYHRLKDNDVFYAEMLKIETELNKRKLFYIPKDSIPKVEARIKSGDIVVFTTSTEGLDVSHVGFAVWQNDSLCLMHASSKMKKVVISEKSIYEYTTGIKSQTGIIVARLQEPEQH